MPDRPLSVSVSLGFILLNALVWIIFGVITFANTNPSLQVPLLLRGIMALLSIAIAGILLGLFIYLRNRRRIAYYLTLGLLVVTLLLNFFDDVGLVDLVVIFINIIPIILLVKDRAWFLQVNPQIKGSD